MANKNPWTGAEIDRVIRMYEDGHSAYDIAQALGRHRDGILRMLRAHGITTRGRGAYASDNRASCLSYEMMCEDAFVGSMQLLAAIERAGVRP